MDKIIQDETKIKIYGEIQKELCNLRPKASKEEIDKIIDLIPQSFLNQKEELMMLCHIFSYYARCNQTSKKGNALKLFQRIISPIKSNLQDESSFFWSIFGGHFYFKLWMHEEGLISIDKIIQCAQSDDTSAIAEYFFPEIMIERPEIFENETKYQLKIQYSPEAAAEFRELRKKHMKWLLESGDFHDPFYREIESNRLRLAIKTDDFESFQKILSNLNLSIDSKISESTLENFYFYPHEVPIIEYAMEFNAINIFKFLVIQNVNLTDNLVFGSIQSTNYEIIHVIESKMNDKFKENALKSSLESWNGDMTEYVLNNYEYEFLYENDAYDEKNDMLIEIIYQTFSSFNFIFLQSTVLPFLRKNPSFVSKNIYEIVSGTFFEMSGYFTNEFLKYPGIDISHETVDKDGDVVTFLGRAIQLENIKALEILLSYNDININSRCFKNFSPFHLACKMGVDMKIIKMLSKYHDFDINFFEPNFGDTAFGLAVSNGNFYALQFIIDNFDSVEICQEDVNFFIYCCIKCKNYLTMKIMLRYFLNEFDDVTSESIVESFKEDFSHEPDYNEEYINVLKKIINTIVINN